MSDLLSASKALLKLVEAEFGLISLSAQANRLRRAVQNEEAPIQFVTDIKQAPPPVWNPANTVPDEVGYYTRKGIPVPRYWNGWKWTVSPHEEGELVQDDYEWRKE